MIRRNRVSEQEEVRVARISAAVIGGLAIVLSIFAQRFNVAFLVALAFAVAASANLPTILYTLFWRRFTSTGAVWSIYGGLTASVVLVFFSPVVSGNPSALLPSRDFAWFPLENPGLFSIPFGFLMGIIGTLLHRDVESQEEYDHMELRSLTGVGVS